MGYELVYVDTDSVFIKKNDCTARDYQQLIDTLSMELVFQSRRLESD
jgi:hypothetical protein